MKFKTWLREYKHMTYAEYKALEDIERLELEGQYQSYCHDEQMRMHNRKVHDSQGWRLMTDKEKQKFNAIADKEKIRYAASMRIGGIDERGNYIALHHRWSEA